MISNFLCIMDVCMYGVLGFDFNPYQIILLSLMYFKVPVNLVILFYIKILQHFTQRRGVGGMPFAKIHKL